MYPKRITSFIALALFASLAALSAQERRVALVIGNGKYQFNTTLKNPANDAQDMGASLKAKGFAVTSLINATRAEMEKGIRDFGAALKDPKAVGLFFYSGHGTQAGGQNYILPVDADIQDADELPYKAVDVESVLAKMRSGGNKLNIVILDACRNNPFPGATRSAERGLAVVKVKVPESVIVYATDPGSTAADGDGRNSPFTRAFLDQMEVPGQDLAVMMKRVTSAVRVATKNAQSPWVSSNLSADFAFVATGGAPSASPAAAAAPAPALAPASPAPAAQGDFVTVPAGSFMMGSPDSEANRNGNEGPQHNVNLPSFLIGKYEVTFDEYDAYCEEAGAKKPDDHGWGRGRRPAIYVNWYEALAYCNWRSEREGFKPCYTIKPGSVSCDFSANGYRLPTEAEWEYAAKGGPAAAGIKPNAIYAGSPDVDKVAWYSRNSSGGTHPVGKKKANGLGLYDMAGNVWEWCWDYYRSDFYKMSDEDDPTGPISGSDRVYRGGSYSNSESAQRSADRGGSFGPTIRSENFGFRLVRRP
jgi:formylglycine-generating enzyme required for sulfatase activity